MILRACIPQPPLSEFVDLLWQFEGRRTAHAKERVLPTGTLELVINLRHDTLRAYDRLDHQRCRSFRGPLVCGAHSEFFVIDTADQELILGVHFKPGGAFPFFNLPLDELHNAHVSLDALWGAPAAELREQLLEAATGPARFHLLEQALLVKLRRPRPRHPAVAFAVNEFQTRPARAIADVTAQIGLSARHFIRVFREQVGMTPKLFCRIRRFQEMLQPLGRGRPIRWADVALECGYFDQAHFVHDFRAFSGLTPTDYLALRGPQANHVPLRG